MPFKLTTVRSESGQDVDMDVYNLSKNSILLNARYLAGKGHLKIAR